MLLVTVVTASLVGTGLLSSPNECSLRRHKRWAASGPESAPGARQKPHEVQPQSEGAAGSTPRSCSAAYSQLLVTMGFVLFGKYRISTDREEDVSKGLRIKLQQMNNNPTSVLCHQAPQGLPQAQHAPELQISWAATLLLKVKWQLTKDRIPPQTLPLTNATFTS